MACTSNESLYCFLAAASRAGIPSVCSQHVFQWLVRTVPYLSQLSWRIDHLREMLEDNDEERYTTIPEYASNEYVFFQQVAEDPYRYEPFYWKVRGFNDYSRHLFKTFNVVCKSATRWHYNYLNTKAPTVTNLPLEAIRGLYHVLHSSSSTTKETFKAFVGDVRLLPFAAFLAGAAWNGEKFFQAAPNASRHGVGHFLVMGILASDNENLLDLPGWAHKDEKMLFDILNCLLDHNEHVLLVNFEHRLDLSRTSFAFATRFLRQCVFHNGYTEQLHCRTRTNERLLMHVLHTLIRDEVSYSVIMKFECMVVLHTQKEPFRIAFAQAVRKRKYTA